MQDEYTITKKEVNMQQRELLLEAEGTVVHPVANGKLRILCVFVYDNWERRFPVEAECKGTAGGTFFQIAQTICLPAVFYQFTPGEEETVKVTFEYCDAAGEWHSFCETLELAAELFEEPRKKNSVFCRCFRIILYLCCTILLPIFLLDGFFAVKGWKRTKAPEEGGEGKKAVLYHAQGIVMRLTGYGYSLREMKTAYFRKQYGKACGKYGTPEGILFLSERIPEAGGNLQMVQEALLREGKEYKTFLDSRPIHKLPLAEIKKAAHLAAGAEIIILEDFYPQIHALALRKETKLIQLWHACGAFKMFGLSDIGKVKNLRQDTQNHRSYSYAFVSGSRMVPFYSEAFGIAERQVLPLGVPRTDIFFDEDHKQRVCQRMYEKYPQLEGKKAVLFAPTFRGSGNKDAYYPWEYFDVNRMMETLPEDSILILKNHPFVKERPVYDTIYQDRVLDMSGAENINDILFLTSLLITDYSSCIFEAALLEIPMLFYVFDLEDYIRTRDFYFDFASFVPGKKAETWEALLEETEKQMEERTEPQESMRTFCSYFMDAVNGDSTRRIVEFIQKLEHTS